MVVTGPNQIYPETLDIAYTLHGQHMARPFESSFCSCLPYYLEGPGLSEPYT